MTLEKNKKIFKNDIGVTFRVYAGIDISNASVIQYRVHKPGGSTDTVWTASLDGTNNKYATFTTTVTTELDEAGDWLLSLELEWPGGNSLTGGSDKFVVYDQFEDL